MGVLNFFLNFYRSIFTASSIETANSQITGAIRRFALSTK